MTRKYWPKTYWPKTYWQKHIVKNILWRNILWKNILVPKHITVGCRIIRMDLGFDNNQRIKEASYTECKIIMSKIYQLWMDFCCHHKIVIKASKNVFQWTIKYTFSMCWLWSKPMFNQNIAIILQPIVLCYLLIQGTHLISSEAR